MITVVVALAAVPAFAADPAAGPQRSSGEWTVTGPFGGSVRALAVAPDDPSTMFVGTSDGQLYRSRDAGATWSRTIPGFDRPGMVIDNLVIDPASPRSMYIGVWAVESDRKGGVFKSVDGGDTWRELPEMHDHSIRALELAPGESNVIVAGALDGVFRSEDAGRNWKRISPEGHAEIRNIESIAIDPRDSEVIYAGTWHLPWKTSDGGETWSSIKQGIIDDSDMFSIAIIQSKPDEIFASACSGIYQTRDAGANWKKVQGIPFTSRRTRMILPHPTRPEVVFAGTTQGLWRTMDDGKTWQLMTTKSLVINDIDIAPDQPDRVFLGTDNYGVLVSENLGASFLESNAGFIHRHVLTLLPDQDQEGRVYATMYGDSLAGGIFISTDGGRSWRQSIKGLGGRDVFALYQDPDSPSTIFAGTSYGVYRSRDRGETWGFVGTQKKKPVVKKPAASEDDEDTPPARPAHPARRSTRRGMWPAPELEASVTVAAATPAPQRRKKAPAKAPARRPVKRTKKAPEPVKPTGPELFTLENQVNHFERFTDADGKRWMLAATSIGLFRSTDPDKGWERLDTGGVMPPFASVATAASDPDKTLWLGSSRGLAFSKDGGMTWTPVGRGPRDESVKSIAVDPDDPRTVYVGCRGGLFKTSDGGRNWRKRGGGLPAGDITVVAIDPGDPSVVYAGDYMVGGIFRSKDRGEYWERLDSGLPSPRVWSLAPDPFDAGRIYAGSFSGGVYVFRMEPEATGSN